MNDLAEITTFSLNTPLSLLLVRSQLLAAHARALWQDANSPTSQPQLRALDSSLAQLFAAYGGAGMPSAANATAASGSIALKGLNLGLAGAST